MVQVHVGPLGECALCTNAPVAQLARAPRSHRGGCRFKSGLANYGSGRASNYGTRDVADEKDEDDALLAQWQSTPLITEGSEARTFHGAFCKTDALVAQSDGVPVYETGG